MISRAEQLANQRRALQLRCALQRRELALQSAEIEARLAKADRILGIAALLIRNPIAIVAGVTGIALLKPWRLVRWAGQGWLMFNMAKKFRDWTRR